MEKGKGERWEATQLSFVRRGFASRSSALPLNILFLTKVTLFVYLPLKSCTLFIQLLHENKSPRKEVFQSFSSNLNM